VVFFRRGLPQHTGGTFEGEKNITAAEVSLAVKTLKAGKVAGWDETLPEILKV